MNISYSWLQDFLDLPEAPDEVGRLLTGTGLEVEEIERIDLVPGGLANVVLGTVLTCERHPDADKLSLTTVDAGQPEPLRIVCGAPNVRAGQRVVVALVGATLHPTEGDPFTIKKAKIRGAASEGMLCAEDELGLGTSHDGILVLNTDLENGTPAAQFFGVEADHRIVIGLTPNRADAASHLGVARDLRAVFNRPLRLPDVSGFSVDDTSLPIDVAVENAEACPIYTGVTLSDITVAESPDWLKRRLRAIGLTPINNVVDVTNYVLHEMGQPLHAFDADAISEGRVVVKTLPEGTPFTTLDGVARTLAATDLMICNGAGEPMCIGGVFGGRASGVSDKTTRVFLEAAYFSPAWIRRTGQRHGLKTDASFRFERGVDPNATLLALQRAAQLIRAVAGGRITSNIVQVLADPSVQQPFRVPVRYKNIDRLIGIPIPPDRVRQILESLDIRLEDEQTSPEGTSSFVAVVPPYRVDVQREADVIEEVLRIYGLDNVPLSEHLAADTLSQFPRLDPDRQQARVSQLLAAGGFQETMALSFTRPALNDALRTTLPLQDVALLNPLSEELSVMRQTLLFSVLETLVYNLNRRQRDLKIFEFGKGYGKTEDGRYVESLRLALALTGNRQAESWQHPAQPVQFHDVATVVQNVLKTLRIKPAAGGLYKAEPADNTVFQYGLTYYVGKRALVSFGLVQPALAKLVDARQSVFHADFDWATLLQLSSDKLVFEEVPRFPDVRRDLSLVLDRAVTFADVNTVAQQTERKLLRSVNVFDVYEGEKIGDGKKAYAVSFILQDPGQTLTDAVIDRTMQRLMQAFENQLGAVIRK